MKTQPTIDLRSQVEEVIKNIPFAYVDQLTEASRLQEDLDFDSIDMVELVMDLEATFDLEIADAEAERFRTVGDVVEYVTKRKEA